MGAIAQYHRWVVVMVQSTPNLNEPLVISTYGTKSGLPFGSAKSAEPMAEKLRAINPAAIVVIREVYYDNLWDA
jgi:hypothetical protein